MNARTIPAEEWVRAGADYERAQGAIITAAMVEAAETEARNDLDELCEYLANECAGERRVPLCLRDLHVTTFDATTHTPAYLLRVALEPGITPAVRCAAADELTERYMRSRDGWIGARINQLCEEA